MRLYDESDIARADWVLRRVMTTHAQTHRARFALYRWSDAETIRPDSREFTELERLLLINAQRNRVDGWVIKGNQVDRVAQYRQT